MCSLVSACLVFVCTARIKYCHSLKIPRPHFECYRKIMPKQAKHTGRMELVGTEEARIPQRGVVFHQDGLSSGYLSIRVDCHQDGLL